MNNLPVHFFYIHVFTLISHFSIKTVKTIYGLINTQTSVSRPTYELYAQQRENGVRLAMGVGNDQFHRTVRNEEMCFYVYNSWRDRKLYKYTDICISGAD